MSLSALSPFGPIFSKELRITARRKRTYWLRVIYLGLLMLFMLLAYLSSSPWNHVNKIWASQQQAALGRAFFLCFSMFCVLSMALLSPVLTATAVNSERLGKTLPVLLMTPINVWQIVTGKLLSRLLIAFSLIGLSLPVLALVRLLGGVEISQMLIILGLCITQAIFGAAVGLFFSTLINRAYAVILQSYCLLFLIYFIIPLLLMVGAMTGPMRNSGITLWTTFNPIVNCALIAEGSARQLPFAQWQWCIAIHLFTSAVLLLLTGILLRRRERKVPASETPALVSAASPEESAHITRRRDRHVSNNPVLWREQRRPLMPKRWQAIVAAVIVVGLMIWSYNALSRELADRDSHIGYAMIFNGLIWLLVAVISATSIATEIESDTWTLLLTTPLTPRQIVFGKVIGLGRRMIWPLAILVLHFGIFAVQGVLNWEQVGWVVWIIVSCNTIWIATGTYLSLRCKKVTFAVVMNMLLAVVVYVLVFVVLLTMDELRSPGSRIAEWVAWYLPYYHLGEVIHSLHPRYTSSNPIRMPGRFEVLPSEYRLILSFVGALYLVLSIFVISYTVRRFDKIVGRAPQTVPE